MQKYIGDKAFYKRTLALMLPILFQNAISTFVSLLDNIMVGSVGTYQMTGVSIANQLLFVFNLCIFGAVSGAGIFGAQFFGDGNHDGVRYAFRYRIIACLLLTVGAMALFIFFGDPLLASYVTDSSEAALDTLKYGREYLDIMLIGLIPFALSQSYSSALRETGKTFMPMLSGIIAVFVNLFFNWVFIYGKLGVPAMGAAGAAIATVISRFAELLIIAVWAHTHTKENIFIKGSLTSLYIPKDIIRSITVKGFPLLMNEALWAAGIAKLAQCYAMRGIDVIAAMNINNTIGNVFNIIYLSMGSAISIIIGQMLGAGKLKESMDEYNKLTVFSIVLSTLFGIALALTAKFFPMLYNTEAEIKQMATYLLYITACEMPLGAYLNAEYFTIRSGGKTVLAFIFDSAFTWAVNVTVAYCLARFTDFNIYIIYGTVIGTEALKCILGYFIIKSGAWQQNIVSSHK